MHEARELNGVYSTDGSANTTHRVMSRTERGHPRQTRSWTMIIRDLMCCTDQYETTRAFVLLIQALSREFLDS